MRGRTKGIETTRKQVLDPIAASATGAAATPAGLDFRAAIEAIPAAVYMTDAQGRITYYNEAAAALWGHRPALGESRWCGSWRLFWPDGRPMPHHECPMAQALKENRPITGTDAIAERPDGSRVHFMPYPTPLYDATGTLIGAVNVLVDVTERRRALKEAKRLASIIESSDDAIISKDLNGIITSWNRGAENLFGYTAEEAIGQPVVMLIPPDRKDEEPGILERIRRGERIDHFETVRRKKDGSLIDISLTVSPVKDADGRVVGASKIARDITERKREQQQQHLLVGEIKHRIKNTLATVQAIARQTLTRAPAEERDAFIARLAALANAHDLLTIERWNRAALRDVVDRALRPFHERHGPTRLLISGPEEVWLSAQRASLFTMALHELATNAVKYGALSNEYGVVLLQWEKLAEGDETRVRIVWSEIGGPPVTAPERKGFGSFLVERGIEGGGGSAQMEFRPDGLVCTLELSV